MHATLEAIVEFALSATSGEYLGLNDQFVGTFER